MRFHAEATRDSYDVIVVGSGIGGLAAAALLARAGRRVLVAERHDRVGGYAHAFRRSRYLFDSAVHVVGGCEPVPFEGGGLLHRVLSALGVRERLHFERLDPCYAALFGNTEISAPPDLEEFVRVHTEDFGSERKGLRQFLQECLNIRQEAVRAAELEQPFDLAATPAQFPTLLRYRRATLGRALDDHLDSAQLKAHVATLWPYLGLPPSRLSFLYFANMLMSYVADGTFYCRGSFQRLADTLAEVVVEGGGELLLKSPVRRIRVEGGAVRGITLENGQRIDAPRVLSNADALQTVEELVGTEAFPARYTAGLRRLEPSISAFVVYLATDLPLDRQVLAHETFLFESEDHERAHRDSLRGVPSWLTLTAPSLVDPELAPSGEQLLVLTTLVPYQVERGWRAEKEPTTRRLLRLASRRLPGLEDHLSFVESGTPRTLERYTRNRDGALYGWALTPAQVGPGRPGASTPVAGLHLVGHWAQPGGGISGVVSSGVQAARTALGLPSEAALWRELSRR